MKFKNLILVGALFALAAVSASAQDYYAQARTYVLTTPTTLNTIGASTTTNGPIDVRALDGKVAIDIFTVTNNGGATLTATFQTSDDTTNWYALPNYALATATSVSTTNYWGGYSNAVSQTVLMPSAYATPTAWSAGFSTGYLTPIQYTNTGALSVAKNGLTKIAYPVEDGRQYLRVIWTQGGGTGATNAVVGAAVSGLGNFPNW